MDPSDAEPRQRLPESLQRRMHLNTSQSRIKRRKLALVWSYAPDWVLCIGLSACFYFLNYIHGYWREFDLTDTSIQHSYAVHERVPDWMLYLCAGLAPVVLLPFVNFCSIRSWWDLHIGWLGLILSLALTGVVTQATKVTVGRPRPDLIARCLPKFGSLNAPVFGLVTAQICTQTDILILKDGFRSFPSGHSSLSFAGLGFLSFYVAGKIHLFDERGHTPKAWIALTPLIGAALIAISRTMDNRHHWHDVTAGSTLGLVLAFFAYRQYYPPLWSPMSHLPYRTRTFHDQERSIHNTIGTDLEGGFQVPSRDRSAMNSEEDLHRHTQHRQHKANVSVASVKPLLEPAAPQAAHAMHTSTLSSRFKPAQAEEMEMDESIPDEERGVSKPAPPKSIEDIWKEERQRGSA